MVQNSAPQPSAGNKELRELLKHYYLYMKQCELSGDSKISHTAVKGAINDAKDITDKVVSSIETLVTSSNQQLLRELEAKQDAYYLAHDGEGEAKMVAGLSAIIQDKLRSTDNAS